MTGFQMYLKKYDLYIFHLESLQETYDMMKEMKFIALKVLKFEDRY